MSTVSFVAKLKHQKTGHEKNGNITVTSANSSVVSNTIENGGSPSEIKVFTITGTMKPNTLTKIATIKIEASTDKMFTNIPYLRGDKNIRLKLIKKVYTHRRVTSYTFNLMYKVAEAITASNVNEYLKKYFTNIHFFQSPIKNIKVDTLSPPKIYSTSFGDSVIKTTGETRNIKIKGVPGTAFQIALLDGDDNDVLNGDSGKYFMTKRGDRAAVLSQKIPTSGTYIFKHRFPSVATCSTRTSTNYTGVTKFEVDDLKGAKSGDVVYNQQADKKKLVGMGALGSTPSFNHSNVGGKTANNLETMTVTIINPDGDNPNELAIDSNRVLSTGGVVVPIEFARPKSYNLITIFDHEVISSYTLNQYLDPILTFELQMRSDMKVHQYSLGGTQEGIGAGALTTTSFANGHPLEVKFRGEVNCERPKSNITNYVWFKYVFVHGSANFTVLNTPTILDHLNHDHRTNGGTKLTMGQSYWSGLGTNTATLVVEYYIEKYGTSNVTLSLDIENLITHS